MSKAILVIDKPEGCRNCPLFDFEYMRCNYNGDKNNLDIFGCPLKEIPYKMEQVYGGEDGSEELYEEMYMAGWNACIDEILGEEHEQ